MADSFEKFVRLDLAHDEPQDFKVLMADVPRWRESLKIIVHECNRLVTMAKLDLDVALAKKERSMHKNHELLSDIEQLYVSIRRITIMRFRAQARLTYVNSKQAATYDQLFGAILTHKRTSESNGLTPEPHDLVLWQAIEKGKSA